jgi:hypothetical protein
LSATSARSRRSPATIASKAAKHRFETLRAAGGLIALTIYCFRLSLIVPASVSPWLFRWLRWVNGESDQGEIVSPVCILR